MPKPAERGRARIELRLGTRRLDYRWPPEGARSRTAALSWLRLLGPVLLLLVVAAILLGILLAAAALVLVAAGAVLLGLIRPRRSTRGEYRLDRSARRH